MANDQNVQIATCMADLNNLLNGANNLGELKLFLKPAYKSFVSRWNQCDEMTNLDDYGALRAKINEIPDDGNAWFYIGYTGQLSDYLWHTTPKSDRFQQLQQHLVKSHTYYRHLQNNEGENEQALINEFIDRQRCLNESRNGEKKTTGIVYVLVYTQPN